MVPQIALTAARFAWENRERIIAAATLAAAVVVAVRDRKK